jgi:hypothetical protein
VCTRLVELVSIALVGYDSEGLARGEEVTVPCSYTLGTARSRSRSAGNAGLAPGTLGVQGTASEQHDGAVLGSAWSRGWVGLQRGGGGELVGEVGRPGVLPTP